MVPRTDTTLDIVWTDYDNDRLYTPVGLGSTEDPDPTSPEDPTSAKVLH